MRTAVASMLAVTAISAVVAGCDAGGETIGPRGGTVSSADGRFSLEIPEGALEDDVDITIEEVECDRPEALGPCYAVEPRGTGFIVPAEVSYEIADMDLAGIAMMRLGVVAEREDAWRVLADRSVDVEDEVVYASATYLSTFALVPVE